MKWCFAILGLILCSFYSSAQDKIYFTWGKVITVKITDINDKVVHYTLPSDSVAERHTADIANITSIEFENGTKQFFDKKVPRPKNDLVLGIIPFQLFSRSYGAYIGIEYKRFSCDYRYTYTFAVPTFHGFLQHVNERPYYHGDNNTISFSYRIKPEQSIGVILGHKHWWFSDITFSTNGEPTQSSFSKNVDRSSNIKGFNFGLEYSYDLSKGNYHSILYVNASGTWFQGTLSTKGGLYHYYEYRIQPVFIHMAIGTKFGGKIKLGGTFKNII